MLRVRRGNLLMVDCRLQGPLAFPPESYHGLIRLDGPGTADPERTTGCAINRSLLLSGKAGIEAAGAGIHCRLQQSVLVTRQEAFRLDPGRSSATAASRSRLNVRCLLENTTVAAQRAVVSLADAPQFAVPSEPVIFQARNCAFVNPFPNPQTKDPYPAALLLYDGDALSRGLLIWQGEGNLYDGRLPSYAAAKSASPPPAQSYALWARLWGTGERQPLLDAPLKTRMDPAALTPLDGLAVPGLPRPDRPPGADLRLLGIVRPIKPPI
jgi:hypothetical protein